MGSQAKQRVDSSRALEHGGPDGDTGKTDAKDVTVIADQARILQDLTTLRPDDEHAIRLRVLTGRQADAAAIWRRSMLKRPAT
jgi:hypothetical protein